jgi:hypothetical protein
MGDNKSTTESNIDEEENELSRLENVEPEMIKICEKIILQLEDFKASCLILTVFPSCFDKHLL